MPFCPNCRTEYVDDVTRCADCGAELVAWAPAGASVAGLEAARPAELCELEDQVQLDLVEANLRAVGIPTVRRARRVALFVPASRLAEAHQVLAGRSPGPPSDTVGLSELTRIRLICAHCEQPTSVDLAHQRIPAACSCGHLFDLSAARPVLDRYADLIRTMADADYEIELELPEPGD